MSGKSSAPPISLHDMQRNNFNFYLGFIIYMFAILNPNLSDMQNLTLIRQAWKDKILCYFPTVIQKFKKQSPRVKMTGINEKVYQCNSFI